MWLGWGSRTRIGQAVVTIIGAMSAAAVPAVDVPPIRYTGELLTTARVDIPEEREKTYQLGSSTTLGASTYLWQPWFATVVGNVSLFNTQTRSEADSSALLTSGDLALNVFPRSRFPFSAFVDIKDRRQEFSSRFTETRDRRLVRYGLRQQYRPLGGSSDYSVLLERTEDESSDGRSQRTTNRADLSMGYRLTRHNISARLNLEQTDLQGSGVQQLSNVVATLQHGYRPTDTLTIDNFASFENVSTQAQEADIQSRSVELSSFASWNPRDSKLSMTGDLRYESNQFDSSSAGGTDVTSGSLAARYAWTPELQVTGAVQGSLTRGTRSSNSTRQTLSLSYSPPATDLLGFQYDHSASASASNRTDSTGGGTRNLGAGFGHGLSRVIAFGSNGSFSLSGNVGQTIDTSLSADAGNRSTLTHSGSLGIAHSGVQSTSRVLLNLQDSRAFGSTGAGTGSVDIQSINLHVQHDSRFGRFATLTGGANVSWVRQFPERGTSRVDESSAFSLTYRHGRVLGVRRLRFTSMLEIQADSLTFLQPGDEEGYREVNFDNSLKYSIGRVDLELEYNMTESNGRFNQSIFFSLKRRIAGVL